MSWFLLALIAPALYALAHHTDKYLLSKYFEEGAVGAMTIFSALFGMTTIAVAWTVHPNVVSTPFGDIAILVTSGALSVVAILCYFYALHRDEASHVIPLYQTIPIFGFGIAYLLLGETISAIQGIGSLFIILGAVIISLELGEEVRFRKQVMALMLVASVLYATCSVLFKFVAVGNGYWTSLFWTAVGQVSLGLFFLVCVPPYRKQFLTLIHKNRLTGLGLNALSEIFFTIAEAVSSFVTLLVPVVLVLLVNSFQSVFVLIFGIALSLFFPHVSEESLAWKHLAQKITAIGLMVLGAYFIGL